MRDARNGIINRDLIIEFVCPALRVYALSG
jgi:hypothetical protein